MCTELLFHTGVPNWDTHSLCSLQCTAKFTSAVYAAAYPSVCPSVRHTPVLCQNEGTQRDAVLPSGSPVSLVFLMPRMVYGGRPIDSEKSSLNANRKSTMGFLMSHQPRSCVPSNFLKTGFRYPNLSFFAEISTKNH